MTVKWRSICFNLGQFVLVFLVANKKIFLAPSIFSSSSFFSSSLLTSLTTPSLLSQHLSPYSFYLNAYLVSLEPQTFGFPLDSYLSSEPWRLGCKFHNCLYYIYIVVVINFLKLFKLLHCMYMYLCHNYIQINLTVTSRLKRNWPLLKQIHLGWKQIVLG